MYTAHTAYLAGTDDAIVKNMAVPNSCKMAIKYHIGMVQGFASMDYMQVVKINSECKIVTS